MDVYSQEVGLFLDSQEGRQWTFPKIAFLPLRDYGVVQPPAPASLKRYGRLERPQLLLREGRPVYLFCASQGGAAGTAPGFMLRIS